MRKHSLHMFPGHGQDSLPLLRCRSSALQGAERPKRTEHLGPTQLLLGRPSEETHDSIDPVVDRLAGKSVVDELLAQRLQLPKTEVCGWQRSVELQERANGVSEMGDFM